MKETNFKHTDIGDIPHDWNVVKLGEVGYTYNGITGKSAKDFGKGDAAYITFLNVLNNPVIDTSILESVNIAKSENQNSVKKGDLFFNTSSETPEDVGTCAVLLEEVDNVYLNSFCFGYRLIDSNILGKYLAYYFRSKQGRSLMTKLAQGATRYNLSKVNFNNSYISLPPTIAEQERIATALSQMDELISALDEQINKKMLIKQASMQQLLTAKTRLNGFSESWVKSKMKDVAEMNSGGTPSSKEAKYYGGDIPFLSISDMTTSGKYIKNTEKKITQAGLDNSSARVFPAGTLMYAMYASLGKCSISTITTAISQAILGFKLSDKIERDFLYYHLCYIEETVKKMGQTGTQANLSKGLVEEFDILLPSLAEQRAIASILTTMDNEIQALQAQRDKYTLIKQGMMQQLLTGKIRI